MQILSLVLESWSMDVEKHRHTLPESSQSYMTITMCKCLDPGTITVTRQQLLI